MCFQMSRIIDELNRIGLAAGGSAVFFLDFSAWFPYLQESQNQLKLYASLSTEPGDAGVVDRLHEQCVQNHRCPNKGWVCMTRKVGRKLFKYGGVFTLPALLNGFEVLNMFRYLNLGYSYQGRQFVRLSVPIDIQVTDDKPWAAVTVQAALKDLDAPEFVLTVREGGDVGWRPYVYSTDPDGWCTKMEMGGQGPERLTVLTAATSEEEAMVSKYVICNETVKLIPCAPEDIMV